MEKGVDSFEMQIKKVSMYMKKELNYSDSYIDRYKYGWRRIKFYLSIKKYKRYEVNYEKDLCEFIFGDKDIRKWNDNEQLIFRSIKQLSEFVTTGKITMKYRSVQKHYEFDGNIGQVIKSFLDSKKESFRSGRRYVYCAASLCAFNKYCLKKEIHEFSNVNLSLVLQFISEMQGRDYANLRILIPVMRQLLKYAFESRILIKDISEKVPYYREINTKKLPSVYSEDEIKILLESINRNTKVGKRNYAVIILATYLGIRGSDIANLKFENIDWDKSTISFVQIKTEKHIVLPLLSIVGNAIVDYLKFARPISKEPYIFISCRHPYAPFSGSNVVTHIVQRAFKKTSIDITSRKFGSHALRHSLASRMLESCTVYPTITEVLGHKDSNSTMVYLNIDLKSLELCLIDVPMVSKEFYEQKGGVFYA